MNDSYVINRITNTKYMADENSMHWVALYRAIIDSGDYNFYYSLSKNELFMKIKDNFEIVGSYIKNAIIKDVVDYIKGYNDPMIGVDFLEKRLKKVRIIKEENDE